MGYIVILIQAGMKVMGALYVSQLS